MEKLNSFYRKFKSEENTYRDLMRERIRKILLVSTYYDAFIFEQESRLVEQVYGEYNELNLSNAPKITCVPSGYSAINEIKNSDYDLIIIMVRIGEMSAFELAQKIKEANQYVPIVLLLSARNEYSLLEKHKKYLEYIDEIFMWNGNPKLFLALIKCVEDKKNMAHDVSVGNVRIILLVEDSIHYYSLFLPFLYSEVMVQTRKLIDDEVSDVKRTMRMRARPKVILCHSYDTAHYIYEKYKNNILCVISDSKYPMRGAIHPHAGIALLTEIHADNPRLPLILQSSDDLKKDLIEDKGFIFISKHSPDLLSQFQNFILHNLGFGDFIFRTPQNTQIDKACSVDELHQKLHIVPDESILYHSEGNHFSAWLNAHGEGKLAEEVRRVDCKSFTCVKSLRAYIINIFETVLNNKTAGKITDFNANYLSKDNQIIRMGKGSMGGKGRGLAFLNAFGEMIRDNEELQGIALHLPATVIIGTEEFDIFIKENNIFEQISGKSDAEIDQIFLNGHLSRRLKLRLYEYLAKVNEPIAVRSSGLLEDNLSHPFAGLYKTFLLPNNAEINTRYKQISRAIKLVYASLFQQDVTRYIKSTSYHLEEEKMAIILQKLVGTQHGDYFYPDFSGVAQSYNYYPGSFMKHTDYIATLALGLGKAVVERDQCYTYSPLHPKRSVYTAEDIVRQNQRHFYALNIANNDFELAGGEDVTLEKIRLSQKILKESFNYLCSVWDYNYGRFIDSSIAPGPRVITYRNINNYDLFPLNKLLEILLRVGSQAFGVPVEIEFSVLNRKKPEFHILQIRPLAIQQEHAEIIINRQIDATDVVLYTKQALGNGISRDVSDIIYIHPDKYDNIHTHDIKNELEELNIVLGAEQRRYVLVGPGRWGSSDAFLGIPVKWNNISEAQTIVEIIPRDGYVEASNGSHFFHNLIAMNVGYYTINEAGGTDYINWEWLAKQKVIKKGKYCVHIRCAEKLLIKTDGKSGQAIIRKHN